MSTATSKKTTDKKPAKSASENLETETPLSEKDEVKKAEERTKSRTKGK